MRSITAIMLSTIAAVTVLGGCASTKGPPPALARSPAATPATPAPVTSTPARAPVPSSTAATAGGASTPVGETPPSGSIRQSGGCPVSADTLMAALRADTTGMSGRAGNPTALRPPSCADGFALASAVPDGVHEAAQILFAYDPRNPGWHPLNVGSSDLCSGFVPASVIPRLTGCI